MSDRLSKILNHEISEVNKHLPVRTVTLQQALRMDRPGFLSRSREFVSLDKKELELISEWFSQREWGEVELPIFLTRRRDLGPGAFYIGGSVANIYLIRKLIDKDLPSYHVWKLTQKTEKLRVIYRPEYAIVRKHLKSLTVPAFA
ncbi:MAG: DUF61 family protein [Methanobacteriota archaeon]|nr:MAG: DUF61 family protein [Euryarchaeota archaeon]